MATLPGVAGSLAEVLADAAAGNPPQPDGGLSVLLQPSARDAGVVAFTGHSVVFADVAAAWVRAQLPAGDLSAPLCPPFLAALGEKLGRRVGTIDVLAAAPALPGEPEAPLAEITGAGHPRVQRARRYRDHVTVWGADGAIVILGRGVAGRWEVAVEVQPSRRGKGVGRSVARAARHLIPAGEVLWAQIAPGNAASVRAFLAAGFCPLGAEVLLPPG